MKSHPYSSRWLCSFAFGWLIAPLAALAVDLNDSLVPLKPNFSPGPEYADAARLDAETIARTVEQNPNLKSTVMTYIEKLHAEGLAEGMAIGTAKGLFLGKIQLLEELMGLSPRTEKDLNGLELAALQNEFEALEKRYNAKFKSQE